MRSFIISRLFVVLLVAAVMVLSTGTAFKGAEAAEELDIVETAAASGSFNTLVAAVNAAGLTETLKGDGPFTVFAPTDEAFAKLPEGTLEMLLKPENKEKLAAILTYHVVSEKVTAEEVVKLSSAESVSGKKIEIKTTDGKVMVDGATVIKTDVMAENGVIHVIDTVMMPPAD
jgi:uncharacterized surface protein with fasciclin (FAS1) repeats